MRCELALQISRQLHLQRTYFFPAGAGRIACNKQQKIGKCQYVNIHHFCTRYGFLTTAWNAAILWHTILLLRSELHTGICRWRKRVPYKAAGWARLTHAARVLSEAGWMQAGLPAATTDGHVGVSPGCEPTGPCRMCWYSRRQWDKPLDGGTAPSHYKKPYAL